MESIIRRLLSPSSSFLPSSFNIVPSGSPPRMLIRRWCFCLARTEVRRNQCSLSLRTKARHHCSLLSRSTPCRADITRGYQSGVVVVWDTVRLSPADAISGVFFFSLVLFCSKYRDTVRRLSPADAIPVFGVILREIRLDIIPSFVSSVHCCPIYSFNAVSGGSPSRVPRCRSCFYVMSRPRLK